MFVLFQIAEQLKAITDELPKDIQEETKVAFMKLFQKTSVFTITRENIQATCASIMVKHSAHFPSGWHQIAFIYYGEISSHYELCTSILYIFLCSLGGKGPNLQFHFPLL